MKKLILFLFCLITGFSLSQAEELKDTFSNTYNSTTYWSAKFPTTYSTTASSHTSVATGVTYTIYNAIISGSYIQLKANGGYISFSVPNGCTEFTISTNSGISSSATASLTVGDSSSSLGSSSTTISNPLIGSTYTIKNTSGKAYQITAIAYTIVTELDTYTFVVPNDVKSLTKDDSYTLPAGGGDDGTPTFKYEVTSGDNVVSLSDNTLTAKEIGTATIKVTWDATSKYAAETEGQTFDVNVVEPTLSDYTVAFPTEGYSLFVGDETALPEQTGNNAPEIKYDVSDAQVIAIGDDGKTLKALAAGTATVTASWTAVEGRWNEGSATANVTVSKRTFSPVVSGITLSVGATKQITFDEDNQPSSITFTSGDEGVVTVDGNTITAVAEGTTMVTASWGDETWEAGTATISVTVKNEVEGYFYASSSATNLPSGATQLANYGTSGTCNTSSTALCAVEGGFTSNGVNITFDNSSGANYAYVHPTNGTISIYKNNKFTITAPEDYVIKSIKFTASSTSNNFTYLKANDSNTTACATDGSWSCADALRSVEFTYSASSNWTGQAAISAISVICTKPVESGMKFEKEAYEATVGSAFDAPKAILPEDATGTVTYSAEPDNLFTIDSETGAISNIISAGEATVTATFAGDAKYKPASASYTLKITVDANVILPKLSIDDADYYDKSASVLYKGAKITISAPDDATDYNIYYRKSESDEYTKGDDNTSVEIEINDDINLSVYINDVNYAVTGQYTVVSIGDLTISPDFGNIQIGSDITVTCATDGATVNVTAGENTEEGTTSVTFKVPSSLKVDDTLEVTATATHPRYKGDASITGTYTITDLEYSWVGSSDDAAAKNSLSATYTLNDKSWTVEMNTSTGSGTAQKDGSTPKGYVFGSKTDILKSLSFSTDEFKDYEVTKVVVSTLYKGGAAGLTVSVDGDNYGDPQTISATQNSYTFTGNSLGTLKIVWDNFETTGKQVKVYGITVSYRVSNRAEASLSWSTESATVAYGEKLKAPTLTVSPAGAAVNYSSSNTDAATIAADGTVTVNAPGTTVITASIADTETYKNAKASYTLTVNKGVATLAWSETEVECVAGNVVSVPKLTVTPDEAAQYVEYQSSDSEVAAFNGSELKALSAGTITISAYLTDNDCYTAEPAKFTLTVSGAQTPEEPVEELYTEKVDISKLTADDDFVEENNDYNYLSNNIICFNGGSFYSDGDGTGHYYVSKGNSLTVSALKNTTYGIKQIDFTFDYSDTSGCQNTTVSEMIRGEGPFGVGNGEFTTNGASATWTAPTDVLAHDVTFKVLDNILYFSSITVTWDYITPIFYKAKWTTDLLSFEILNEHSAKYRIVEGKPAESSSNKVRALVTTTDGDDFVDVENGVDGWTYMLDEEDDDTVKNYILTYDLTRLSDNQTLYVEVINGSKVNTQYLYKDGENIVTGITDIVASKADGDVQYYNLQGVRVNNPTPGIYIVRQGSKVTKQVIR